MLALGDQSAIPAAAGVAVMNANIAAARQMTGRQRLLIGQILGILSSSIPRIRSSPETAVRPSYSIGLCQPDCDRPVRVYYPSTCLEDRRFTGKIVITQFSTVIIVQIEDHLEGRGVVGHNAHRVNTDDFSITRNDYRSATGRQQNNYKKR